jgi:5-methylcytosine-specific restriction protein B
LGNKLKTIELLSNFLLDAESGNLKTAQYPKKFKNLFMKVSFGMGGVARVPWISFFTPEMSTSNGYYPVYLFYKEERKLVLSFGVSETNDFGKGWDDNILERVRR